MAFFYLQRNHSPLGAHAAPRNPLPLWWRLRVALRLGIGSRLARWWQYYPGHWWRVARHPLSADASYPVRHWLAARLLGDDHVNCLPDSEVRVLIRALADSARRLDEAGLMPRRLTLVPPADASPDAPADAPEAAAAAAPKPRRDPAAPHGYGDDGAALAPFGYRKDGRPRVTKPRVCKPSPGRRSAGRVRRTLRRVLAFLRGLPRRRAVRRARLAESVKRHPSGLAA